MASLPAAALTGFKGAVLCTEAFAGSVIMVHYLPPSFYIGNPQQIFSQ
jgi:hypothetical protein